MKKRLLFALALLPAILVGCQKSSSSSPTPPNPALPEIVAGTIPVVFHVLYENSADPEQYPSDAVIQRRLAELNKFYSSTLFTDRTLPGVPSQKVGLTFVAATHDPNGKPLTTPGIHRVVYSGSANMSAENFLYSNSQSQRNQDIFWNPNYYVNIWLFSFLQDPGAANDESEVTGISFLPYCTTTHTLFGLRGNEASAPGESYFHRLPNYMHGIALNNRKFQPEAGIDPEDQYTWISDEGMLTLCHEMGHYLGLHHAFDETRNGCSDPDNASDDGCEDTPKYNRTYDRYSALADGPKHDQRAALPSVRASTLQSWFRPRYFDQRNGLLLRLSDSDYGGSVGPNQFRDAVQPADSAADGGYQGDPARGRSAGSERHAAGTDSDAVLRTEALVTAVEGLYDPHMPSARSSL